MKSTMALNFIRSAKAPLDRTPANVANINLVIMKVCCGTGGGVRHGSGAAPTPLRKR